ncbi:hypothetical protein DFA_09198 [Cavenderia fasciculata]|uniref:Uncharacterized protein n=1 Tax=Cavenderia fasciculata TaxID=261658 RepID=F4Q6Y8_CACFS|nr:uncharacterized protein DFA_09198 [Cavenderia fasciculata]EGG16170.1 hypothetical protein DFA_09198 [Cavenderia fasciculata]|eukprot:XP_004352623.1 hypothetical protein DFA_09198 [Cavenderia fasciculata]
MTKLLHYLEYQILDHYFTDNNIFGCQDLGSAQPEYFGNNGCPVKSTSISKSMSTLLYTPYNRVEVFNLNVVCKRWFGHLLKLLNDCHYNHLFGITPNPLVHSRWVSGTSISTLDTYKTHLRSPQCIIKSLSNFRFNFQSYTRATSKSNVVIDILGKLKTDEDLKLIFGNLHSLTIDRYTNVDTLALADVQPTNIFDSGSLESILHHSRNSLQSIQIVQTWETVNKVLTILQQFLNPSPIFKSSTKNNNNNSKQNNNNNLKSIYLFLTNTITHASKETKELVSGQLSNIFCQLEHSLESITLRHVTPLDTQTPQLASSLFGHVSSNAGDEIYPNLVHLYLSGLDDTTFQYSNLDLTRSPPTVNSRLLQYLLTTKVPRVSNTMTLTSQTIEIITTNTKVLAWTIEIDFTDESILSILPFTTPSHITELKIIISKSIKPLPIVRLPTTDNNYNNSPICPIRLDNNGGQLLKLSLELFDIDCDNGFFGFYQFQQLIGQAYNIKLLRISTRHTSWCDHGGSLFKTLIDHNPNLATLQLSSLDCHPPIMIS